MKLHSLLVIGVSRAVVAMLGGLIFVVGAVGSAIVADAQAVGEKLVWADEFSGVGAVPDRANWGYEVGGGGWGNGELETYCAPGSPGTSSSLGATSSVGKATSPGTTTSMGATASGSGAGACVAGRPNAVVKDGVLHVVARRDAAGRWTSARLTSKGLKSFQYGRIEARIKIPAGEGVWPAFWMLGDDVDARPWPACGELDIMENIGKEPGKIHGSVHGTGFTGTPLGKAVELASGKDFADAFHMYGVIWEPGKVQYYVDDPGRPYATFTRADLPKGAVWPFDDGRYFVLLNLAMGGAWPGPPTAETASQVEMLVDYVRVYQEGSSRE